MKGFPLFALAMGAIFVAAAMTDNSIEDGYIPVKDVDDQLRRRGVDNICLNRRNGIWVGRTNKFDTYFGSTLDEVFDQMRSDRI